MTFDNPILTGFHPDPSILRVGEDYYIATSTFEWFPGVRLHHSRDLVHWRTLPAPLDRVSQLDMAGTPDSTGVWAPCLSHDDAAGLFYLIYTNVKGYHSGLTAHNYLVTAPDILGPWSEPVYLNSIGFDPSLFHDGDGRKWLVTASCNHAQGENFFGGIVLQEYGVREKKLVDPSRLIFRGTPLGKTEGPHLYKRGSQYYLITAEGGTDYNHAVTLARAKRIEGPYEVHPENPILTSRPYLHDEIQKAGHASLVETPQGEAYLAHLCGRPLPPLGRCILGRETCLQKMVWCEDGWLRMEGGGNRPRSKTVAPGLPPCPWPPAPERDDFDSGSLGLQYQTLRGPLGNDALSLTEQPGWLRLKGKENLGSLFHQALVARRQQCFRYEASTCVEFEPVTFRQMAGLVCYYNTQNYHYLYISRNESVGKHIGIVSCDNHRVSYPLARGVCIEGLQTCHLRVRVEDDVLQFYFSQDAALWETVGPALDATALSDEHYAEWMNFTGAFVGLCCQDLEYDQCHADFGFFEYRDLEQ